MSETVSIISNDSPFQGLGFVFAAFIIVSETAGSGILALPQAMVATGYWGLPLIVVLGILMAYNGSCLGKSYEIILEEGSTASHRDPYPVIAEVSGSTIGRKSKSIFRQMTIVSMVVMNYGSGVVFLVLIAQYLNDLFHQYLPNYPLTHCHWIIITGILVTPTTWLGSPKDLGVISLASVIITAIACILIIIRLILDYKEGYHPKNNCPTSKDNEFSFQSLLGIIESYSTVMFAFAGASVYPSIQDDMRNKSHFKYTAILSIVLIICMYVPVSWLGYALIGDCVNRNVILSLKPGIIKSSVEILLILHLYTAITIFLNPIHQYFEFLFHINLEFNWKRIAFRSSIMALMIFVGLSIPEFSNLLDFIGSGPSALINFILPPCFYLLLVRSTSGLRSLPILERILCVFIASSGLILAFFGVIISLKNIIYSHFTLPCYLK